MRKHCISVRQLSSPGNAERSELMLCVATIGISRAWRDSANVRSSPVGSVSPTVAKAWYSSQMKTRSRQADSARGDLGNSLQDGPLEIELEHHAETPRIPDCGPTGKFSARPWPARSGRRGVAGPPGAQALERVVRLFRGAETCGGRGRVVVKKRQEDGDAFDDRRT